MTISSDNRKAGPFDGNDAATVFPYAFVVFSADELLVIHTDSAGVESTLTEGPDYSATVNPDQNADPGGDVTLPTPLPSNEKITITSALAYLQTLDLANQGGFYPDVIERALDRIVVLCQQNAEQLSRSIKIGISDDTPADEYRDSLLQAARDAVLAAQAAQASQTAAATSETNAAGSAASALASQTAAASSEANTGASEAAAASSSAAAATSETNAAGSASDASAAASSASDSAAEAAVSQAAAATSEANAATSETNAAASASSASDSADRAEAAVTAGGWMSMPVGMEFPLHPNAPLPPTDDPSFRYIILTAGLDGAGQYNEGVLTDETVTGSDPTITATAVVSLAGSPMDGQTIDLINTSRVFLRPGPAAGAIVDSKFGAHKHTGGLGAGAAAGRYGKDAAAGAQAADYDNGVGAQSGGVYTSTEGDDETAPRYIPRVYLMRIL